MMTTLESVVLPMEDLQRVVTDATRVYVRVGWGADGISYFEVDREDVLYHLRYLTVGSVAKLPHVTRYDSGAVYLD